MFVDPYLLGKVYQRGSLKNTQGGFQFTLKNVVDSGTLGSIKSLSVDGVEIPLASIALKTQEGERRPDDINYRSPLPLRFNAEITIRVAGEALARGVHKILLAINVLEAGGLQITFQDEIQ